MKSIDELAKQAVELKNKGMPEKEIATELHLSTQTVQWLLSRGFEKKTSAPRDVKIGWRSIGIYPYRISKLAEIFADIVIEEMNNRGFEVDSVVGIAINGIPIATFLAEELNSELIVYRPQPTNKEGTFSSNFASVSGKKIVIVDDVISTGETMSKAIKDIKNQGGVPVLALTIVNKTDRDEVEGVRLRSLIRSRLIE
ncbi:MAG: orotate phosphoribosyltransferase-like protein [Thermoplasmata archaeon]|nr:orotate phosphoribosyltransferase-like protein [Thermoplasmata archaeon]